MNRFKTFLLLFVFFLYQAGFYLFYLSVTYRSETGLENYGKDIILLEKSIPITLPYQADQAEYQDVQKIIEDNGKFYRVIKQKYSRDTLHIVYMADHNRENLHTSLKDWVNSLTQPANNHKKAGIKDGLEKNYLPTLVLANLINYHDINSGVRFSCVPELLQNPMDIPTPPPEIFLLMHS